MIRLAFEEESMSRTRVFEWHGNSPTLKEARQKSKVKSMLIIFFDIKGIDHKGFVLAGQTVNSAYYCDVLWPLHGTVRRFRPKLQRQKNWLLHNDNAPSHTSRKFFLAKTT
jgi:hypothetical protein